MEKRKAIKCIDIIIIIAILVVASIPLIFIYKNKSTGYAEISLNGKVVKVVNLEKSINNKFTLEENNNVQFEVDNKQIRFINIKCPDKICESVGYISKAGEVAICMPNKAILKIVDTKSATDLIVQ